MGGRSWHTLSPNTENYTIGRQGSLGEITECNRRGFYQDNVTETQAKISSIPLLILQIFVGHLLVAMYRSRVMGHSSELIRTKSLLLIEYML